MIQSHMIEQKEALGLLDTPDVVFVDGSWYLPAQKRDAKAEYQAHRIPGAVYFDIDAISDKNTDLPHMLPEPSDFAAAVGALGISHNTKLIIYDGPGLFSAARVWWTFRIMGAKNVRILKGGLDGWRIEGLPLETGDPQQRPQTSFIPDFDRARVIAIEDVIANTKTGEAVTIDARPLARFQGKAPEPRAGMRSGHIPGSHAIPATDVVENGQLLDHEALEERFRQAGIEKDTPVISTCGSGVTAAILILALEETGRRNHRLFDGSWAQWGKPDGPEVATDE
ncbi:MAG: 3-mercaptopyruvate sulfurtransferase [Pseudomonadota bacterium]